jgi:dTDP-4-dehydrorhamnose reductase
MNKMKKILILGASGLLGSRLQWSISNSYGTFFSSSLVDRSNLYYLDAMNLNKFSELLKEISPDVVINCVGFTNVDECERFPEKSWDINCKLPVGIADICFLNNVKFVQISTDHYLNITNTKLLETDAINLVNQYSYAKFHAEKMIKKVNQNSIIIRVNFFHFNFNSPRTFLDKLVINSKDKVNSQSYNDVLFSPVSTKTLVLYLNKLLELNFSGLINVSSNEVISKYDFHRAVLACLNINNDSHRPISIDEIKLRALRPKYMALDNSKLVETTGINTPSIYDMIREEINQVTEDCHVER